LQISRFTASKPSKSAIASVEKFTRQLTTLIARYFLKFYSSWRIYKKIVFLRDVNDYPKKLRRI